MVNSALFVNEGAFLKNKYWIVSILPEVVWSSFLMWIKIETQEAGLSMRLTFQALSDLLLPRGGRSWSWQPKTA